MNSENFEYKALDFIPEVTDWTCAVRGMFAGSGGTPYQEEQEVLFDDKIRNYAGPAFRAESKYSFYDRSALEGYERVRKMLQRWVDRMPPEKQKDIVGRMRHKGRGSSREAQNFGGAFFELFLNEFLNGTGGYTVVDPKVVNRTPDFGVTETQQDGTEIHYLMEASDIDIFHSTDFASEWNELQALDILDEIKTPAYRLSVETEGTLTTMPRKRDLKEPFEQLVNSSNYEDVSAVAEMYGWRDDVMPKTEFQHGGWSITGTLIPVPPESQPRRGRFIGIGPMKSGVFADIKKKKRRLYEKAERCKEVDNLIIALRCDSFDDSLSEALFGHLAYTVYFHEDPADTSPLPPSHSTQVPDGFWFNTKGPLNQNVIGVVEFNTLYPHCVDKASAVFYANPYTAQPLPAWTRAITHAEYKDGKVEIVKGVPPCFFVKDHEPFSDVDFQFEFQ